MAVHYFCGEDTLAAQEAIEKIATKEKARVRWLDRHDIEVTPFQELVARAHGLLGREVVVVREVSTLPIVLRDQIVEATRRQLPGSVVLWDRGVVDRRSAVWRALKDRVQQFDYPAAHVLVEWVQGVAKKEGGSCAPEAARLMVQRLSGDRQRMKSEIVRLVLGYQEVTAAIVEREVEGVVAEDVFKVLEAVARREKMVAIKGIEHLLAQGHSELYILSMLAYEFRTLLSIREGIEAGLSAADIGGKKGLSDFVVGKHMAYARQFTPGQLLDILTRILATDFAIKRGKIDMRTGVLMLGLSLVRS